MATVTAFQAATPAMIVGHGARADPLPLALGEPFALLGGDRLGPDGIPFLVMHDHQPDFLAWVRGRCDAMLAAERPWFGGSALMLRGKRGSGRTHAARWLARVIGVPHVILNLTDPVIAAGIAASGEIGESMGASPVTIAMAADRCANPVVTVIGADRAGDDVLIGLSTMMDPQLGRRWREDRLRIDVDLGEVSWLLQCDANRTIPSWVAPTADEVVLDKVPNGIDHVLALSICCEVMGDLGIDPVGWSWKLITAQFPNHAGNYAETLYEEIVDALRASGRVIAAPTGIKPSSQGE